MKKFLTKKWKNFRTKNNLFFCFILLFLANVISAQEIIEVRDIKGSALIAGDVSPKGAKLEALNNAKIKALEKAGIEEHIKSNELLFSSQQKNDYSQFFSSDIQSEIQGAVQSFKIKSEKINKKSESELICEVTIDATVVKYKTKPDVSFDAIIDGIKAAYNNNEDLIFALKTTQHCYLTIFNITDNEALLLFPNEYEKQMVLDKSKLYKFPFAKIDYTLVTNLKESETNRLIFVFTKTEIPFIKMDKDQNTTTEDIFSWIYSIMPDQRKVEYKTFLILK